MRYQFFFNFFHLVKSLGPYEWENTQEQTFFGLLTKHYMWWTTLGHHQNILPCTINLISKTELCEDCLYLYNIRLVSLLNANNSDFLSCKVPKLTLVLLVNGAYMYSKLSVDQYNGFPLRRSRCNRNLLLWSFYCI